MPLSLVPSESTLVSSEEDGGRDIVSRAACCVRVKVVTTFKTMIADVRTAHSCMRTHTTHTHAVYSWMQPHSLTSGRSHDCPHLHKPVQETMFPGVMQRLKQVRGCEGSVSVPCATWLVFLIVLCFQIKNES